jgi:hypothetical protein
LAEAGSPQHMDATRMTAMRCFKTSQQDYRQDVTVQMHFPRSGSMMMSSTWR